MIEIKRGVSAPHHGDGLIQAPRLIVRIGTVCAGFFVYTRRLGSPRQQVRTGAPINTTRSSSHSTAFFFYLEAFYAQLWSLDRRAYSHIYSPLAGLLNANRFKVKSRVQVQFIPGRFFSNGNREELLEPSGGLNGIFGGSSWVCSEVGPFEWRTEEVRNSLQCQLSWLSASSL